MEIPATIEGWEVWDVIERGATQLRIGALGPVGLDYMPLFGLARLLGYNMRGIAEFLPSVEAGMMEAFTQRMIKDEDGQS